MDDSTRLEKALVLFAQIHLLKTSSMIGTEQCLAEIESVEEVLRSLEEQYSFSIESLISRE